MTFRSVGDALSGIARGLAEDEEFRWSMVERAWLRSAGQAVGSRAVPSSFADGVLTLRVVDPQWLPTLHELGPELLRAVRQKPGGDLVRRLEWVTE